ncbi:Fasciclin domain [Popillia japonica]|uniref:Fasciclin domain n=1 Tax=Popillia japonica TaxID=7064 RepID=A0AAW1K102_POPJA
MLNDTYHLGQNCGFNRQFNDTTTNQKYTFFVPRDRAWQQARVTMPSAIKKLFMLDFCYYAVQVLERHLIVGDVALTMERIKAMANDTSISYGKEIYTNKKETELGTVRDSLKIAVEERINSTDKNTISGKMKYGFHHNK